MSSVVRTIVGDPFQHPLEQRIYNIVATISVLICLIAGIYGIALGITPLAALVSLAGAVLQLLLYYLSRYRGRYTLAVHVNMAFFIYVFTPVIWLSAGGLLGSIPPYTILFAAATVILVRGPMRHVYILSLVAIIVGLVLVEWHYPQLVFTYGLKGNQYVDVSISFIVALMGVSLLFLVMTNSYDTQRLRNENTLSRMLKMATTDELTGLANHRFILAQLESRIAEAKRYDKKLTIILLDLDHFKEINDFHGHGTGDAVLRHVGDLLAAAVRTCDIVGRFGGEEFIIITPETDATGAAVLANRIRTSIAALRFERVPITLTASGGVCQYRGHSAEELLSAAGRSLHQAREEGRNRVAVAS